MDGPPMAAKRTPDERYEFTDAKTHPSSARSISALRMCKIKVVVMNQLDLHENKQENIR